MTGYDDELDIPEQIAPTPQDWGFPSNATVGQRAVWNRQEMFLEAYKKCGKRAQAAKTVGLTLWCVDKWVGADVYSIQKRMELAHREFCENVIEQEIDNRLADPKGNRGSDILLMFKAKAEMPSKYREDVKVVGMEPVREMLDRLTEMAARRLERERRELEQSSVEGEYRDLGRRDRVSRVKNPGLASQTSF
jgi:hypothetical protein